MVYPCRNEKNELRILVARFPLFFFLFFFPFLSKLYVLAGWFILTKFQVCPHVIWLRETKTERGWRCKGLSKHSFISPFLASTLYVVAVPGGLTR